jgi:multicomponent Na+:H+ antiporter subunit C
MILFLIGLYTVISKSNLIKKLIGLNIMETSVFLFFISIGAVKGGRAPIMEGTASQIRYVNPLPQALILTGIVVAVSTTALALSLIIKIYEHCGTIEAEKLKEMEEGR